MYRTEAEFSRAIITKLKSENIDVTRLESHGTGVGIPDMFIQGNGHDCFLELKNSKIVFRPGQLAWHETYYLKHARRKSVITLVSNQFGLRVRTEFDDDLIVVPKKGSLARFLFIASERISYAATNRIALVHWVHKFFPSDMDWDPDVIECIHGQLDKKFDSKYMNSIKYQLYKEVDETFRR